MLSRRIRIALQSVAKASSELEEELVIGETLLDRIPQNPQVIHLLQSRFQLQSHSTLNSISVDERFVESEKHTERMGQTAQTMGEETLRLQEELGALKDNISGMVTQLGTITQLLESRLPPSSAQDTQRSRVNPIIEQKPPPLTSLTGGSIEVPSNIDTLIALDPYLKNIKLENAKHAMTSDKFESFYFYIGHTDPSIKYLEGLQFFCLLNAPDAGVRALGTQLFEASSIQQKRK